MDALNGSIQPHEILVFVESFGEPFLDAGFNIDRV
jgi:hypothetical protein